MNLWGSVSVLFALGLCIFPSGTTASDYENREIKRPEVLTKLSKLPFPALKQDGQGIKNCTTPNGGSGICILRRDCPKRIVGLMNNWRSACHHGPFQPGVCCPLHPEGAGNVGLYEEDCGHPEVEEPDNDAQLRVIGGNKAVPGRWPWLAAIHRNLEFVCGGTLITPRHVLTAAQCTHGFHDRIVNAHLLTVLLGDFDMSTDEEPSDPMQRAVTNVRLHPAYLLWSWGALFPAVNMPVYDDIAILELDSPVVVRSKFVRPICMPPLSMRSEMFVGEDATMVGWGSTAVDSSKPTYVPRQVQLPVWAIDDCVDRDHRIFNRKNFLCAGGKVFKGPGKGDTGGPLMVKRDGRWLLIGVTSQVFNTSSEAHSVFTRVTEYMDWIQRNIEQ